MKEQQTVKAVQIDNKKDKEKLPEQRKNQQKRLTLQSQKDEDALQSSIAQQEVILSQTNNKQKQRKNSVPNIDQKSQQRDSYFDKFQPTHPRKHNSFFLLAESLNNRMLIVTIQEVKVYEEKAKSKNLPFRLSTKVDQPFLKVQNTNFQKQDKHLKKSLSSSKICRQKQMNIDSKHTVKKSQHLQNPVDIKANKRSQNLDSVNVLNQKQRKYQQSSIHKSPQSIQPHTIPFSYQNITTAINNLQHQSDLQLQIDSACSVKSQSFGNMKDYHNNGLHHKKSLKNKKTNEVLKQLNSSKYMIDVPMDMNEFQYQLKMEVTLEKNRGFQLYLITPQISPLQAQESLFDDVQHFKYEIVRMPYNLLRLRVYLLIATEQNKKNIENGTQSRGSYEQTVKKDHINKNQQEYRLSYSSFMQKKQWKVWKQMQFPFIYNQKQTQHSHQHFSSNKKIKITLTNVNLNTTRVEINNRLDFHITLNHPKAPVSYYCIHQDFNGVEFNKISLSGSQGIKTQQDLLGEGCQGKCQLI